MHPYTIGDIVVKNEAVVSVFVLDSRLVEDVVAEEDIPMVIHYVDGDVDVYDNVLSFDQTDGGFWVETETLNFRFDNYYEDDEELSEFEDDSDEIDSDFFDEYDF